MLMRHCLRYASILLLATGLAACGGSSSSGGGDGSPPASASKATTLGTRGETSQPYGRSAGNAKAVWTDYDPPMTHAGGTALPTQFITMRDGVRLAVSVTLPADESGQAAAGPFPVILVQTSYNLVMGQFVSAIGGADPYMTRHGYATVIVDVRGTGNSGGTWAAFGEDEQGDYAEVVDWVVSQPWSNDRIGLYGVSYLGITSVLTAAQQHPAVKAAFPIVPIGDGYRDIVFTGGQVNPTFIPIWMGLVTGLGIFDFAALQADPAMGVQTLVEHLLGAVLGFQVPTILKALLGEENTVYDGDFWRVRSPIEQAASIKVPTFVVGGLHDLFQRSEPMWFERLKDRVPTKLLIGPWSHIAAAGVPDDGLPADGVPAMNHILLHWFDQYVKGLDVGADKIPNVTQYVKGLDRYVTTTDWPHPQVRAERLFLRGDKSLNATAPTGDEATSMVIQHPIGGICSQSLSQWTAGLLGLLPLPCFTDDGADQVPSAVFSTPVMTEDYYINGPIQADIWISTTALESGLSVRVSDYDPATGKSAPLSNGLLTASLRAVDESRSRYIGDEMIQPWHPFTKASVLPVTPNEPLLLPVEIFPTSAMIAKGHQLRVAISASNVGQGLQPLPTLLKGLLGAITIHNSAEYPSSVVLPVVPASALQ
mgnify:CR=1 FL=1